MNSRHVKRIASCKLTGANGKPISRSRWKDGFGGDYGPSRGDPRTGAFRPKRPPGSLIWEIKNVKAMMVSLVESLLHLAHNSRAFLPSWEWRICSRSI
jgi:hypothetical protein